MRVELLVRVGRVPVIRISGGVVSSTVAPEATSFLEAYSDDSRRIELGSNLNVLTYYQSIQLDSAMTVTELEFWLTRLNNAAGSLEAQIFEDDNGAAGNLIATSQPQDVSAWPSSSRVHHPHGSWKNFAFDTPVSLEGGKTYWIAIDGSGLTSFGSGGDFIVAYQNESGAGYLEGEAARIRPNDVFQTLKGDLDFRVNGYEGEAAFLLTQAQVEGLLGVVGDAIDYHTANITPLEDTTPPEILITGTLPTLTNNSTLIVDYTVDGVVNQTAFNLAEGANALEIRETDLAGNESIYSFAVTYEVPTAAVTEIDLTTVSLVSPYFRDGNNIVTKKANYPLDLGTVSFAAGTNEITIGAINYEDAVPSGYDNFQVEAYIDGVLIGMVEIPASATEVNTGTLQFTLPEATAGTLTLTWVNDLWVNHKTDANIAYTSVSINQIAE